jgi:hypothetical protein
MPQPPYAKLLVSKNAGALTSGGIVAANGDTLQLSGESTAFWQQQRYEIYAFPDGFAVPAGWSTDVVSGAYYYAASPTPPAFAVPALPLWGKFLLSLVVNAGLNGAGESDVTLTDTTTAVSVLSPSGLKDLARLEGGQFSSSRKWTKDQQDNLRVIEANLALFGSPVQSVSVQAPITDTGTPADPIIGIAPASALAAGSMSSSHFSDLTDATPSATGSKLAKRHADGHADFGGVCGMVDVTCSGTATAAAVVCPYLAQNGNGAVPASGLVRVGKTAATTIVAGRDAADVTHNLLVFDPASGTFRVGDGTNTTLLDLSSSASATLAGTTVQLLIAGVAHVDVTSTGVSLRSPDGAKKLEISNTGIGYWAAAPVARVTYTQNYSTASATLAAYTSDPESGAYPGIDNLQVGDVYARVSDMNLFRVAYENLRASHESLMAFVNAHIDAHQADGSAL